MADDQMVVRQQIHLPRRQVPHMTPVIPVTIIPHSDRRRFGHTASTYAGFSLVEVIVAMFVLSIVIGGAALAVTTAQHSDVTTRTVADKHAIAQKAFERVQTDANSRSQCETGWTATANKTRKAGKTGAASFASCTVKYTDMKDDKGRRYDVTLTLKPVDAPEDGTGTNDADGNLRDRYDATASVNVNAQDRDGKALSVPITVSGGVDWTGSAKDLGNVTVTVCGMDRPDRSLATAGCSTGDPSRTALSANVTLKRVTSIPGNTAKTMTVGVSNGSNTLLAALQPGTYQVVAPSISGFSKFRVDPEQFTVSSASSSTVHLTYVRDAATVTLCTQISNYRAPDDGYEVLSTNVHYRRAGSPVYRSMRLDLRSDRGWACSRVKAQPKTMDAASPNAMHDPLTYSTAMYRGAYDLEIEQVRKKNKTSVQGLTVTGVTADCSSGLKWNKPLNGSKLSNRTRDTANERARKSGDAASWYGTYNLNASGAHRICVRVYSKQFDRVNCAKGSAPVGGHKCFYVRTDCNKYCPRGQNVCVANCNGMDAPKGHPVGTVWEGETAAASGGPADGTVGCTPQDSYSWLGSHKLGSAGQEMTWGQMRNYKWVGGSSSYYSNYNGYHAWRRGGPFYCKEINFSVGSSMLREYPLGTCVEVRVKGYSSKFVRGRIVDISGRSPIFYPTIGAARALTALNGKNPGKLMSGWNPFGGSNSYPAAFGNPGAFPKMQVRKVNGDPVCSYGSNAKVMKWRDPVLVEIWQRIVDDPAIYAVPVVTANGNSGSDKVSL